MISPTVRLQAHFRLRSARNHLAFWVARHLPGRVLYWAVVVGRCAAVEQVKTQGTPKLAVDDLLSLLDPDLR